MGRRIVTAPAGAGGRFLDEHARETLAAAMARIIPSDDGPGASEAGTIDFLDGYLSGERVYAEADGSGFQELRGRVADAWRTRLDAIREQYAAGVAKLDRRARDAHGADFRALGAEQQDTILEALERGSDFDEPAIEEGQVRSGFGGADEPGLQEPATEEGLEFFALLVLHTRQGFYADPVYGGNRDHVGWRHIGFPGPSSMAEAHAGRWDTLEFFAEGGSDERA
jgi:gluconate 2-dehydrogenase gamma chain